MNKLTIRDLDLQGKRVLMRVDFNVPLEGDRITDDTRIRAALPTIRHALDAGASVVLMSHLGRPKGSVRPEMSLRPAAARLAELLDRPVPFATDCVGPEAAAAAAKLNAGEVLLLENLRFHAEEEGKAVVPEGASDAERSAAAADMAARQEAFAAQLAALGDVYVNDAFGTAHRAHASISAVAARFEQRAAGCLLEREIEYLSDAVAAPKRPFVAIIGGAKISGKIDVVSNLLTVADAIIIGGGMAYTFFLAQGHPVGDSLVEPDRVDLAKDILQRAEAGGVKLLLPVDNVVSDDFDAEANTAIAEVGGIADGWMGMDIGPKTIDLFTAEIAGAATVIWNGPLGCFEMAPFAVGTMAIAKAVADIDGVKIIGGGDSVSAINESGLADRMTHISTGGGASLELLEGKELPGLAVLSDRQAVH